jgi:hypothetical protein
MVPGQNGRQNISKLLQTPPLLWSFFVTGKTALPAKNDRTNQGIPGPRSLLFSKSSSQLLALSS